MPCHDLPSEAAPRYPATCTVHWPSGPCDACDRHASGLQQLGNFLGAHIAVTAAAPGAECANCKNEAGLARMEKEHGQGN